MSTQYFFTHICSIFDSFLTHVNGLSSAISHYARYNGSLTNYSIYRVFNCSDFPTTVKYKMVLTTIIDYSQGFEIDVCFN